MRPFKYKTIIFDIHDMLLPLRPGGRVAKRLYVQMVVMSIGYYERMVYMRNDSVQAQESIKVLNAMLSTHQWEPVRRELEFAINELKKCIPTKPFREKWSPNRCPNCNADLGGECDDGYYQNPYYEFCPECRQVLDYE